MIQAQGSPKLIQLPQSPPPPPYTSSSGYAQDCAAAPSKPEGRNQCYPIPATVNPTNFVKVCRPTKLRGVWAIDPTMKIPEALMPPIGLLEMQKNVVLESETSNIDADIFIVPSSTLRTKKRATIWIKAAKGWASLKIHDAVGENLPDTHLPIGIYCKVQQSNVYIFLPQSFRGPLHLETLKSSRVNYTKAIKGELMPISEVNGIHRSFLGQFDISEWIGNGQKSWSRDVVEVNSKGTVNIYFDNEGTIPSMDKQDGECVCM